MVRTNPPRKRSFENAFQTGEIWKRREKTFESWAFSCDFPYRLFLKWFLIDRVFLKRIVAFLNSSGVVWTENIWCVFGVKPQFSNFFSVVWTGFQMFQTERNTLRHIRVFKNPEVYFSRNWKTGSSSFYTFLQTWNWKLSIRTRQRLLSDADRIISRESSLSRGLGWRWEMTGIPGSSPTGFPDTGRVAKESPWWYNPVYCIYTARILQKRPVWRWVMRDGTFYAKGLFFGILPFRSYFAL